MIDFFSSFNDRIVIFTGFWGFEPAHCVPPNHIVAGPLIPPPENLMVRLEQKDPKLLEWLNSAQQAN